MGRSSSVGDPPERSHVMCWHGMSDQVRTFFSFAFSASSSLPALRDCFCSCFVVNCEPRSDESQLRARPSACKSLAQRQDQP